MSDREKILHMKRRLDEIGRHMSDLRVRNPSGYREGEAELTRLERQFDELESRLGFRVAGSRVPERGAPMIQRFERRP
jgi:hypothetical protein